MQRGSQVKGLPSAAAELRRLFASQTDSDAKYFWKHIRYFNSHFSFTSFGVFIDHNLVSARGIGVYCFKAHGQIYHRLDQLVPRGRGPRHMQLYFYDTNETPLRIGSKGCLSLILQWFGWFWGFCRTTHTCFNSRISVRCLILQSTTLNLIQAYLLIRGDITHLGWIRSQLYVWTVMTLSRGFLAA